MNSEERKENMYHGNKVQKKQFRFELLACSVILAAAIIFSMWPVLSAPSNVYPATVDGMGHLTKVKYISDCFKELKWPSWFPYWYNGATVMQYYPPLAYLLLAPVQMVFDNVMITFKFFLFFSQFIGSLGVWYCCYRFIGPWAGIVGAVLYALQPFLLRSLLLSGVVAQGPIFALTPWLLFFTLLLLEKRTPLRLVSVSVTVGLLILSHAMHAFMVSLCIGIVVTAFFIQRKVTLAVYVTWLMTIAFGAGLVSFWWVPGVTQLETPGIPYVLSEGTTQYIANITWYNPAFRSSGGYYFSLSILLTALCSLLLFRNNYIKLKLSLILALLLSIGLSFGSKFPLIKYLPMSQSLFPGRVLSFGALAVAILCALFFHEVILKVKNRRSFPVVIFLLFLITTAIAVDINPAIMPVRTALYSKLQIDLDAIPSGESFFNRGRFTWICNMSSEISFFPLIKGFNMSDGWNVEGTPNNRTIWLHNIAIPTDNSDFVVRNLLQWNTRSAFIDKRYIGVKEGLLKKGFYVLSEDREKTIMFSSTPSSYFMRRERNAVAIGKAAPGLVMHFPWMLQGRSRCLEDYRPEELADLRLIYLIEPEIKDFRRFQEVVASLAEEGKTVIVEMGRAETWPLLGTIPYWEKILPGVSLVPSAEFPLSRKVSLDPDPGGQTPIIGNLDGVLLEAEGLGYQVSAVGYKNVGGNRVYFISLALGQQLKSGAGREIQTVLEKLMDRVSPNKSIIPSPFPVKNADWRHDGFTFQYNSKKPEPVWISITYTPRWRAFVDGNPLPVYNLENLILVNLPAGKHTVTFNYGITWVGWAGIGVSILSMIMMTVVCLKFKRLEERISGFNLRKVFERIAG